VDDDGCRGIADLKDNTKKQAARQALKTGMPASAKATKQAQYGGVDDTSSNTYKAARKTAQQAAKTARRDYLIAQQALMNTADAWKDAVVEDEDDFEGYSDEVLAKRQARKVAGKVATIRYRTAPAGLDCLFDPPDLVLSKEDGIDVVDPVVCVTMQVEGETGVVRQTVNGAAYDMVCSDGTTETTESKSAGETFECHGRVWDIGSIGTEMDTPTSCPSNTTGLSAAEYINAQCCTCL
jgi:hypothetical protein